MMPAFPERERTGGIRMQAVSEHGEPAVDIGPDQIGINDIAQALLYTLRRAW